MRPLRLLLSLSTSLVAVTLLLYMVVGTSQNEEQERISVASSRGSFKAMFSSPFPSSLFPPSAIISLTDDNSTFFLARPAAFGPALPKGGLSGSLWIGSGFGDDSMGAGGELGCSDVPGWEDGNDDLMRASRPSGYSKGKSKDTTLDRSLPSKEGDPGLGEDNTKDAVADDGTDDHLQPGLPSTHILPRSKHADIQSLQESAEIAGKVVLLKRGGCGFLAKVQWAQSRGGVAVIVGDDVRGGALVRMYAKGDTSNITIPSLFTSHTTAHLLSSLYPGDGMLSDSAASHASVKDTESHATLSEAPQAAQTSAHGKQHSLPSKKKTAEGQRSSFWHSFLSAFFGHGLSNKSPKAGSRRLPNSGDLEWVEVSDWEDDQNPIKTKSPVPTTSPTKLADGFVIGEHDWRDPDLLPLTATTSAFTKTASATPVSTKAGSNALPGSGEYTPAKAKTGVKSPWSWWSSSKHSTASSASSSRARTRSITSIIDVHSASIKTSSSATSAHQGLWVTLTPTNVSSSPFFDTLLVLVVSPLVTLTVVYALLLLRSRIRRRRWRAPKSVVERLPVRTYQTISDSSSAATSSAASPTTPLLQHSATRSRSPESRSRSTTVSETPATSTSVQHASRDREEEKRESGLAAWRRRYGGRQRECVVCLEEYVDGVSQVMSLPCGHEFHADCITPWLVTRRRTCPICKGDVVRSLSRSWHDRLQSASPTRSPRPSISEEDVQTEAAETRNMSPSASRPVPMSRSGPTDPSPRDDDIEAGWSGDNSRRTSGEIPRASEAGPSLRELASSVSTVVWRGVDAVRTTTGLQRRSPPEDVDRNR